MQRGLEIEEWAFWSPESRAPAAWREHWTQPSAGALEADVVGDAIPSAHRRRMSALSKLGVQTAIEASRHSRPDFLIFCSQHGELIRTRELLRNIADGVELSPAAFSQSVHNTAAGLYSILAQNRAPATSLAGGAGTFAYGWLEAEGVLLEQPDARALLVCYENPLPAEYRAFSTQTQCTYAVALLLRHAERGGLTLESEVSADADDPLPLAPSFMAWWTSEQPSLRLTADGRRWAWRRDGA